MDCHDARDALSFRLDGELDDVGAQALDAHLARCADCSTYREEVVALHRRIRLRAAERVPDLTPEILRAMAADEEHARTGGLRLALAIVAFTQILVALPALFLGEDAGLPAHTARHLGSFAVALGIGFVVAAWRPERVGGVLPLTAALVACLLLSSALDVAAGRAQALTEMGGHATEIVGLGLLWMLAREAGPAPQWRRAVRRPATS